MSCVFHEAKAISLCGCNVCGVCMRHMAHLHARRNGKDQQKQKIMKKTWKFSILGNVIVLLAFVQARTYDIIRVAMALKWGRA